MIKGAIKGWREQCADKTPLLRVSPAWTIERLPPLAHHLRLGSKIKLLSLGSELVGVIWLTQCTGYVSHYWSPGWWSYTVHDEETCEKHFHATGPLCGESVWCMLPSQVGHTTSRWNPMRNCSTLLCVEATCEVHWKLIFIIALLIGKYLSVLKYIISMT